MRLIPWVSHHRSNLAKHSPFSASRFLNCDACKLSRHMRQRQHCGFVPRAEWADHNESPQVPGWPFGPDEDPEYCAGYLIQLHQVTEAMRARYWKGEIRSRFDGLEPTGVLLDLVETLEQTNADLIAYETRKGGQ